MITLDEQRRLEALRLAVTENRHGRPAGDVVIEAQVFYAFLSGRQTVDAVPQLGWGAALNESLGKADAALAGNTATEQGEA